MISKKLLIGLVMIGAILLAGDVHQRFGFCDSSEASPFGSNNPFKSTKGKTSNYLQDLGVRWISDRFPRRQIEQMSEHGIVYDFSVIDDKLREYGEETLSNAWFIINIDSKLQFEDGRRIGDRNNYIPEGPISFEAYETYLSRLVEYVNTKVPGWQVKYWSIDNEQSGIYLEAFGEDKEGAKHAAKMYAKLVKKSYKIIKSQDPDAKIVFGGPGSSTKNRVYRFFYKKALKVLKRKAPGGYFDFFDYHNFNSFPKYKENAKGKGIDFFRTLLAETGFEGKPIIIKAGATHSGMDTLGGKIAKNYQSEKQQAEYLLKRFVYHAAEGIRVILWATIRENQSFGGDEHSFFNFTGLMYNGLPESGQCSPITQLPCPDPGDGIKKLSYYTFKLLMEKVAGCDWDNVQTLVDGQDNVYVYGLTQKETGNPIWVAWWDYFDEEQYVPEDSKTITVDVGSTSMSVLITEMIPDAESGTDLYESDYPNFFRTEIKGVMGGSVSLDLKEIPVFIEISG